MRFFHATCTLGLEPVLARELTDLGALHVREDRGGVRFQGDLDTALRAVMWVRSASRIGERLFRNKPAHDRDSLYDSLRSFDWRGLITPEQTFAVTTRVTRSAWRDTHYPALVAKDAIVDALRDLHGTRPDVDLDAPDVPFRLIIQRNRAMLVRDLMGDSLHRRGWRPISVRSPLNEAIAAGLLLHTGWDRRSPLVDPMCGSGTFLIEAAHLAGDRAPSLTRTPAAVHWPDVDPAVWDRLVEEARDRWADGRQHIPPLVGADRHDTATGIAMASAEAAEVAEHLHLETRPLTQLTLPAPPDVVVTNPPWGLRLEEPDLAQTWRDLGAFLKTQCDGTTAWVLSGDPELTRAMRLRAAEKLPVAVGPVDCRWLRYPMVARRPSAPQPSSSDTPT